MLLVTIILSFQGPIIDLITKTNDENQAPKRPSRRRSLGQQQLVSHEQVSISEKILMESASEKDRISMPKVSSVICA